MGTCFYAHLSCDSVVCEPGLGEVGDFCIGLGGWKQAQIHVHNHYNLLL